MKSTLPAAFMLLMCVSAGASTDDFQSGLIQSGYLHSPLPLDREHSLDAGGWRKTVIRDSAVDMSRGWSHHGVGTLSVISDKGYVEMAFANNTGRRAQGPPDDPDYAIYGNCVAHLDMGEANLESYNRIVFDITPLCPGMRVVNINFYMANDSRIAKKGYNAPTGHHLVNLENGKTNHCCLEIADLQRDKVSELMFSVSLNGSDITAGDSSAYRISGIRLQTIDAPYKVSGWLPESGKIIYSMTGYASGGRKTALVGAEACDAASGYSIVREPDGKVVYKGKINKVHTTIGEFGEIDFSGFDTPGRYSIRAAGMSTPPFAIGDGAIWADSEWKVLNYIFGQRCGYHVPGIHGKCHTDLFAVHNGIRIPYSGGWHDAGDLSQQTLQTADVYYSLLEAAARADEYDAVLAARMREEALWGLDFALRCRFGDGYRASSMGLLIWQDGLTNSFDDITTVRVQNVSFDNYLHAGYEAYAAGAVTGDPMLCDYLKKVACADFEFAEKEFARRGLGGFISVMEHSYNTSMSQMMATVSWAASRLYALTGESRYARRAVEAMDYVLRCQETETESASLPLCGFFYRDLDRKSLVHSIHQSREQIYMQAVEALCLTQPEHPCCAEWKKCARLYGNYIKSLMKYTAPYGMIPSGVYRDDEYLDSASFNALHLFAPADAVERYKRQFELGVRIADRYSVKRFPIWFSIFNGNLAIHTSMGKAAAIAGRLLGDKELRDIACEQLYWIVGKNPFAQSLIYGEGHDYPMMNSFSSGEITGAMPVGIRSLDDSDEPYWPQINNACYKEVWVTSAGKWLSLLAEL